MGSRGRGAGRSLTAIPQGDIVTIPRAKPPAELTEEQRAVWQSIVGKVPAAFFPPESLLILVEYCRHAITCKRLALLKNRIETATTVDVEKYGKLCKLSESESRTLASLATKLRMTPQSRYSARKGRGTVSHGLPPWEERPE